MLFDGSSLILYSVGVVVYLTNIVKGLEAVAAGKFTVPGTFAATSADAAGGGVGEDAVSDLVKEDSLRTLAASNTILALVLIGVLVLQSGQWYAEKRESKDREAWALKDARDAKEGKPRRGSSSKGKF